MRGIASALVLSIALFVFAFACAPGEEEEAAMQSGGRGLARKPTKSGKFESFDLAERTPAAQPGFTRVSGADCGITFANKAVRKDWLVDIGLDQAVAASGVAAGDYDGDGDIDLYFCGLDTPSRLYRNDGGWKFTDVTAESGEGLDGKGYPAFSASFFDIDGDADLDLYVGNRIDPNLLFVNDGKGHFTEEAGMRGLAFDYATASTAVLDAERDGDLDLYIANYRAPHFFTNEPVPDKMTGRWAPEYGRFELDPQFQDKWYLDEANKYRLKPDPDLLMINDGKGNFTNGTDKAGITGYSWSFNALACDFNDDGYTDLYVNGDFDTADHYWINNGDGTFTNRNKDMLRRTPWFSMGSDAGDLNGDGRMDIFAGDMLARDYKEARKQSGDMYAFRYELINFKPQQLMRNCMYLNRGQGWMTEMAEYAGVQASDWTWSCRIADLDSSGIPEIFATTGHVSSTIDVDTANKIESLGSMEAKLEFVEHVPPLLHNDAVFTAAEPLKYKSPEDNWGIKDGAVGGGCVITDLDGDGDPDIVVNQTNAEAAIWRNDLESGNLVQLDLKQDPPNTTAVGARVWAYCGEDVFTQEVIIGRGFGSGESTRIHLGLGEHEKIDKLEVRWPDGTYETFTDLPANKRHTVYKGTNLPEWMEIKPKPMFVQTDLQWEQKESDTLEKEFAAEPLLPNQRSTLGTGVSVADFNGDGFLDVYFAGPAGQKGAFFNGDGKGNFAESPLPEDFIPKGTEEMAPLCFDADGDGRLDLFVSSGSFEAEPTSPEMRSNFYLNKPDGWKKMNVPETRVSSGSAVASDIDRDGDLDVFVAGRLWPYKFAKPVPSYVFENLGDGKLDFGIEKLAPALMQSPALVSEAQFADIDGDGRQDLILATEFGHVQIWKNDDGKLAKFADAGPSGMWTSLGIGDFDNDGDLDIVAGNWGQNVKYHPSSDKPWTVICDDFDKNGTRDVVEVKYRKDGCMLPGRGRSCSGYAISYIPEKFPTWASFADATWEDIYGPADKAAERYDAEEMRSMILINDGAGNFIAKELPPMAQWAPAFGIGVADFDLDGNLDCYIANNFELPQCETGRWNAGYGVLLLGNGDCTFRALDRDESGISMHWEGRGVVPADFNGDARPDFVVSASNGKPQVAFAEKDSGLGTNLWVSLKGKAPNTFGVGARLKLELSGGGKIVREVQAGSGYLSSYAGAVHFGIPKGEKPVSLSVNWPDGGTSFVNKFGKGTLEVEQH
ncbi:MAG: VCBS repeat-containing protein [bacterium]|jgi:hypothetical protein